MNRAYLDSVRLLLDVAPALFRTPVFALKGGTAINLFAELPSALTANHREFLLGLVRCEPDWSLMSCPHLRDLPA